MLHGHLSLDTVFHNRIKQIVIKCADKTLTKHDIVFRVSMHVLLVQSRWKELHITTPTVNVLFMLNCKLHHQGLVLVAEWIKAGRQSIETSILACLKAWKGGTCS